MSIEARFLRPVAALAVLALALVLSSCARPSKAEPTAPVAAEKTVDAMDPMRARSLIASSFPLEVPVPSGQVTAGKAQGADAWDYEIEVDASASVVADWYRSAFTSRSWSIVEDTATEFEGAGIGSTLVLRKGAAESRVMIEPYESGSRATVVLGIGAPVLISQ